MSIFQCSKCGAAENTALCNYHWEKHQLKIPPRCSACTEVTFGKYSAGKGWHNRFPRVLLPLGMFITNSEGNLMHKETKETDYHKYRLNPPTDNEEEKKNYPWLYKIL